MSPDALVTHYLASSELHAVRVLAPADGGRFRLGASSGAPLRLPTGIAVASTWWAREAMLAERVVEMAYQLAKVAGVESRWGWLRCETKAADGLLVAASTRLAVPIWADKLLRGRAQAAVDVIESELDRRRRAGELRSVNRDYREERVTLLEQGERAPSYGDYVLALKRRMLTEHARRNVEGLLGAAQAA